MHVFHPEYAKIKKSLFIKGMVLIFFDACFLPWICQNKEISLYLRNRINLLRCIGEPKRLMLGLYMLISECRFGLINLKDIVKTTPTILVSSSSRIASLSSLICLSVHAGRQPWNWKQPNWFVCFFVCCLR